MVKLDYDVEWSCWLTPKAEEFASTRLIPQRVSA